MPLLTDRLVAATEWLRLNTGDQLVGYFAASTGAAAALRAAARLGEKMDAAVSRGGRVNMAEDALDEVRAPSLFIVGGDDTQVLGEAFERLDCEKHLYVVGGAGHSFEGENSKRWPT